MKEKRIIIIASFLGVLICLIISGLLFFAVTPGFLVILSFRYRCHHRSLYNVINSLPGKYY